MSGKLKLHPLVKTHDDMRKTVVRLNAYLNAHGDEMNKEHFENVKLLMDMIGDMLEVIPKKYRLGWKEIREQYDETGE